MKTGIAAALLLVAALDEPASAQFGCPADGEARKDRQVKWERIMRVYTAGASQPSMSAPFACKLVRQFFRSS